MRASQEWVWVIVQNLAHGAMYHACCMSDVLQAALSTCWPAGMEPWASWAVPCERPGVGVATDSWAARSVCVSPLECMSRPAGVPPGNA
jgi:hypothetical protein